MISNETLLRQQKRQREHRINVLKSKIEKYRAELIELIKLNYELSYRQGKTRLEQQVELLDYILKETDKG